jgi:hypothetical protein
MQHEHLSPLYIHFINFRSQEHLYSKIPQPKTLCQKLNKGFCYLSYGTYFARNKQLFTCGLHVATAMWLQARVCLNKKYSYEIPKYLLIMCNVWTCFMDVTKYIKYYWYSPHQTQYPELWLVFPQWIKFGVCTKIFPCSITAIFIH